MPNCPCGKHVCETCAKGLPCSAHASAPASSVATSAAAEPIAPASDALTGTRIESSKAGRLAGKERVGEPLFGVAEADPRYDVGCFGACEPSTGGPPRAIRFERAVRSGEGFAFESVKDVALPRSLCNQYASRARGTCLPWVRVVRDPESFRACLARAVRIGAMDEPKNVFKLVGDYMATQDQEVFLAIMLDTQLHVRSVSEIVRGSRAGVEVPTPDVLRIVLVEGASTFIVVHNHPSGRNVNPSKSDKALTKSLAQAAKSVKVQMMDHVIVGVNRFYSFRKHRLL